MTTLGGDSPSGGTHGYGLWDAAYVLGALSYPERREFEAHLRGCQPCAASVSELSGMPALLSQIDRAYVGTIDTRTGHTATALPLRDELLAEVTTHRRRSRALVGAVAVAAAVAISVAFNPMTTAPTRQQDTGSALAMTPVKPVPLTATVTFGRLTWGTLIEVNCTLTAADTHYSGGRMAMVAVGRDGSHLRLATWTVHRGAPTALGGSTSMPIDQIASVQIVAADSGAVLLERDL